MSTDAPASSSPPSLSPVAAGRSALRQVVESGLLHCGLPSALGGIGSLQVLAQGAARLSRASAAAAWVLWAQRLAIEALVQSGNVGLREYLLPDLLTGERAGTLPVSLATLPLTGTGTGTGRGWRLQGVLPCVPNLQWMGFSVVAPLRLDNDAPSWVLLRSEEDRLVAEPGGDGAFPVGARVAALRLDQVFFREDEWLGGPDFPQRLQAVQAALAQGLPTHLNSRIDELLPHNWQPSR